MIKILFVCHGNICRSPMAEFITKDLINKNHLNDSFEVASAATSNEEIGNDIYYPAKQILDKYGIKYEKRKARRINRNDAEYYDYIIVMDENNIRNLNYIFNENEMKKVKKLLFFSNENKDISDPWYTGNFDKTYEDILRGCKALLSNLLKNI